ncbi:MAG: response regulator [Candidatus Babeliales bacterium]|jgi:DNA-binding NtrC family response regulator|nr:MAG: Two component, sigma54 specific, transcriptional regulator, Fis family [candidate division TM6 bacterium GW2011_GWF2_36_6]
MNYSPLILIVDDEVAILQTLKESLMDEGFRVQTLADGNKALSLVGELVPDLIFLDIFMPKCNGLELLTKIKKEYPAQKVMVISGFGNISLAVEAIKNGAMDFIEKPFNLDEIFSKISFLKENSKRSAQNATDTKILTEIKKLEIVGESFLFLELMTQIKNIANIKLPLLIYGEHGTGKTLISRFVHLSCHPELDSGSIQKITHHDRDFTVIDCLSNININSKISDLDGTILIKNIDSLSLDEQKKFVNYLDSDEYKLKNNTGLIKIIVTSTRSLFRLMREDKFNSNLFYKLNITPVEVPSINKRRYDIPLLLDHWVKKFNDIYNKNIVINAESLRYLRNRFWPGNISQIRDLIEKIVILAENNNANVSMRTLEHLVGERDVDFIEEQSFLSFNSFDEAAKSFEKKYLLYVLRKSNFDLQQTSERLNLSITSLSDKFSKLNISLKNLNVD